MLELLANVPTADVNDAVTDDAPGELVEKLATLIEGELWREAERVVRQSVTPGDWKCYMAWKKWKTNARGAFGGQLASVLGTSENNVHQKASRVRRSIRHQLERLSAH